MKKVKKYRFLLLAAVLALSLLPVSGLTLGASGGDARLQAIAPAGATTVEAPSGTTTTVTEADVNVLGRGGAVVLGGSGGTAYLYGSFASSTSAPAVTIGPGWTVLIGSTDSVTTAIRAVTDSDSEVCGVKISGTSTVTLESGSITATNINRSGSSRAYGVYAESGATVNLGQAASTEAYGTGAAIVTFGASGNYGITANAATVNLYHGEVHAQQEGAAAVSVYNGNLTVTGAAMGTQTNNTLYLHTDNYANDTALAVAGTGGNWSITGSGAVFSGYTAFSAAVTSGGGLAGGTFIGNGGPAVSTAGVIQSELKQNCYLRDDSAGNYYAFSNGTRSVSAAGRTAYGTLTVTDAEAELYNAMNGSAVTDYTLPCAVTLQNHSGLIAVGAKTLNLNGKNLEYDGGSYVLDVPYGQTLTLVDRSAWQYANSAANPVGVVRRAASGCAVKVETGGNLILGASKAFGPMITACSADTTATVTGVSSTGTVMMYSGSIYGSYVGAETDTGVFSIAAGAEKQEFSVIVGKYRYGLAQHGGTLNVAGGILSLDADSDDVSSTSAAYPWALYIDYGSNRTQGVSGVTAITGGYFYSVATDATVNGRNQQLADLMAGDQSFVDNQTVSLATGIITKPTSYKLASPTVMRGSENATSKGEYDNYMYYGYAIYNGMADSTSYEYNTGTGLHPISTRQFASCFTIGANKDYGSTGVTNQKICTCCGQAYTGASCPNCTNTRCSVCGKCPNHCTCKNTNLVTDDHYAYISGYPDGTFRPTGTLTRAEAAVIFYKLLENKNYISSKYFSDVNHNDWYYTYVSCLASKGIISGYPDGCFHPGWKVTRAEFCVMAAKFYSLKSGTVHYADVPDTYWAYKYIASAVAYGWIDDGYGQYYPNNAMPRGEVVLFVNRMSGRIPDEYFIDSAAGSLTTFSDVPRGSGYYYQVIEAANGHTFVQKNGVETWKKLSN